ncbi:hypothetical protein DPMN_162298 [Dreissena polymorpha]|uniref:C2H2-type domain-containing protein n=1 Tax=Dreissena polymorpha TaxID=45954 RepID=A0A9D4EPA3_DREPO|nr:hypothetical protein DPMN_162298 [Dreissena polymorpha]
MLTLHDTQRTIDDRQQAITIAPIVLRCSIHGVEKPFPCEQCGKKFSTKDDLNRHVRREVAAKQFTCSICNATLREKIDLQAHLATHNGEKNFACDMCEKRYRHRSSLSKHRSAKHRA